MNTSGSGGSDTAGIGSSQVVSFDFAPLSLERESVVSKEPTTALRRLGDSAILYSPAYRVSLVVNPSVAALWECFDGTAPLGVIADDISAVFALEAEQAWNDVYSLARDLMMAGLLADGTYSPEMHSPAVDDGTDSTSVVPLVLPDPPSR
jgi:hypothetical protein